MMNFSLEVLNPLVLLCGCLLYFTSGGIQHCARWETRDSIAVMSIQDHYFCGFSVPQLFHSEHSTFPVIISSTQVSSSTRSHFSKRTQVTI